MIGFANLLLDLLGKFAFQKKCTQRFAGAGQRLRSFLQVLNFRANLFVDLIFAQEKPKGIRSRGKTIWHLHAFLFERANHLAQRSIFPTDPVGIS